MLRRSNQWRCRWYCQRKQYSSIVVDCAVLLVLALIGPALCVHLSVTHGQKELEHGVMTDLPESYQNTISNHRPLSVEKLRTLHNAVAGNDIDAARVELLRAKDHMIWRQAFDTHSHRDSLDIYTMNQSKIVSFPVSGSFNKRVSDQIYDHRQFDFGPADSDSPMLKLATAQYSSHVWNEKTMSQLIGVLGTEWTFGVCVC